MHLTTPMLSLLLLAALATGCGDDGRSAADAGDPPQAAASSTAPARTGVIEIGGESWTLVPAVQCSVYPGPVVSIAGHAAGDEAIDIVIDYDAQRGPVGVRVEKVNSIPSWRAGRDDLTFEIDGKHVTGEGTFTQFGAGGAKTAQGSFDVTC